MSQLMKIESNGLLPVEPRHDFVIRLATLGDFDWIDAMQKAESDKLGFLMKAAIEKRIEQGNVLVAEGASDADVGCVDSSRRTADADGASRELDAPYEMNPLGYCIAVDRYMKQDHVGQELEARLLEKAWTGEPGLFARLRLR